MVIEEENVIKAPYYETVYLDDDNNKHLAKIKNTNDLIFVKDRFEILKCNYVAEI